MKKTLRNDLILIISLFAVILTTLLITIFTKKKNNLVANIYVKDELVQTVELSKSNDNDIIVKGTNGEVVVSIKDHKIAIIESNCPHQDCVNVGYVGETNRPIICAYNEVYIIIEGNSNYDVGI